MENYAGSPDKERWVLASGLRGPALQDANRPCRKVFLRKAFAPPPHWIQNQVMECLKGSLSITVDSEVDSKRLSIVVSSVPSLSPIGTFV